MCDKTVVLQVAYEGSGFSGFARQPGLRTVQGELEAALQTVLRRRVDIVGAGRTDAGVHALGQVVSFPKTGVEPALDTLVRSLNALTKEDLVVRGASYARAGFSARHSASSREYRYRIVPGPVPPLFLRQYAWWVKQALDVDAMREAGAHLAGEHDFASFCVQGSAAAGSTTRRVDVVEIEPVSEMGEHAIVVRIVGNAFLHSMVRIIVGSLVEVGAGRKDPGWVAAALEARRREAAGPTAPPYGLTLWRVTYPEECWL